MQRVLVTRAAEDARILSHYLARAGFEPVEVPLLQRLWQVDRVAEVASEHADYDVLLLTSATAVDVFATAAPQWSDAAKVAVVGPSTGRRAKELGMRVDVVPKQAIVDELLRELGDLSGKKVLYPKADLASPLTGSVLRSKGAEVVEVVAYVNQAPPNVGDALSDVLPVDVTTVMSGSAASRLANVVDDVDKLGKVVVIGPTTEKVTRQVGLPVHEVARPHTVAGMVTAVQRLF